MRVCPGESQRSRGRVKLRVGMRGLEELREEQAAKARLTADGREAILINTGGGLAGGDEFAFDIVAGAGATLTVTTQAAERVYRTLASPARVSVRLDAGAGAKLFWLPQETILFEGAALHRQIEAGIEDGGELLAVESLVFGRREMGEIVRSLSLQDRWRIRRNGGLIFADDIAIDGALPASPATLNGAGAMATLLLVAEDACSRLDAVRAALGGGGSASAWNGKLVARVLAADGFRLRKALIPALNVLMGGNRLPRVWSM